MTVSARASFTSSSPTLLFFRTGLDPAVMHSIEVVNTGSEGAGDGAGTLLVLGAVNVTTMQPPGYVHLLSSLYQFRMLTLDPRLLPSASSDFACTHNLSNPFIHPRHVAR